MRVALVHDWINGFRGGEKVLAEIAKLYPNAEIHTLFYKKGSVGSPIEDHTIKPSALNRLPWVDKYYRYLFPLFPFAIEKINLSKFDLVISTSHCAAKGVITPPDVPHLCYCHTPVRYAWDKFEDYFGQSKLKGIIRLIMHWYRNWDFQSASRVDSYFANSQWIAKKIKKFYRRKAQVIYPPVDTDFFHPIENKTDADYYLVVSAFAPYKRIDLAITACERTHRRLIIVGGGQQETELRTLASNQTEFLGKVPDERVRELLSGAKALLFPGEEDFGIAPVEAQACGCPVIAYGKGGALESVQHGETGFLFQEQSVESLINAMDTFESLPSPIRPNECRANALKFSSQRFRNEFKLQVESALEDFAQTEPRKKDFLSTDPLRPTLAEHSTLLNT